MIAIGKPIQSQSPTTRSARHALIFKSLGIIRMMSLCLGLAVLPPAIHGATSVSEEKVTATRIKQACIKQARIRQDHGVPKLLINGKPVLPFIFFFNTDSTPERIKFMESQVKAAAKNNVHIFSLVLGSWPWIEAGDKGEGDFSGITRQLEAFVKIDPQATFILRLYDLLPNDWKGNAQIPAGDRILYADGTTGWPSLASAYCWTNYQKSLSRMIRQVEASPYGSRILAYHVDNGAEWFGPGYRESGADYSPANLRAFRLWLKQHYKTDQALATAWHKPGLRFETTQTPKTGKGRFPIYNVAPKEKVGAFYEPRHPKDWKVESFYDPQREKDWVDFSRYTNEAVSQRIIDIAKLIKRETGGRKLTVFFFGYTFDLPSSINGHLDVGRLLQCPDVDILVSPITYTDRQIDGSAGFMSAVDSITAHGKLWLNEDDTRTHLINPKRLMDTEGDIPPINTPCKNFEETNNLLERNLAAVLAHRTGTWWMDLMAAGAFNDDRLWKMLAHKGGSLYREIYAHPAPYRPEVAVIVDPRALYHVKSDYDVPANALIWLRNISGKTGAQTGYYFLDDFISGTVPPCKAYLFANAFYLTDAQMRAIRKRLDREKATAVWQYAPGYLGPEGMSITRASKLTGIHLAVRDGQLQSAGEGALQGLRWGWRGITPGELPNETISPRLTVADPQAEILGRYEVDRQISTARKRVGRHTSVFIGDYRLSSAMLKKIYQDAGVHIWTPGDEVIQTDGKILMVHAGKEGDRQLNPPIGKKLVPLGGPVEAPEAVSTAVRFEAGGSRWFRIMPK